MQIHMQNVNPTKLHDELIEAGIPPKMVRSDAEDGQVIAANVWIDYEGPVDEETFQSVVSNHNPTIAPLPSVEERIAAMEAALLALMGL